MAKWSYLAAGVAWTVSMIYEWMWCGGKLAQYVAWAVIGLTVMGGLFIRTMGKEHGEGTPQNLPAMVWFLLAALTCALFFAAVDRAAAVQPAHVQLMPMYLIMFVDFLATGCYTWWKKLGKRLK